MNPDYKPVTKARDWLKDAYDSYTHMWESEPAALGIPDFRVGDLLSIGAHVALVTCMSEGMSGWRYGVLRDGQMWDVDESALHRWRAV